MEYKDLYVEPVPSEILEKFSLSAGLTEKVIESIQIIRLGAKMSQRYYRKPLYIAYSGGKDSEVLADLAIKSDMDIEFVHSHTTADAPETVYHVREQFKKWREMGYQCTVIWPTYKGKRVSIWSLINQTQMLPTHKRRFCCSLLKETGGQHRLVALGVRRAESIKRRAVEAFRTSNYVIKKNLAETAEVYWEDVLGYPYGECQMIKMAKRHKKILCSPLLNWEEEDVWEYIRSTGIAYNPLYDQGFTRVGCIGCPLAGSKNMHKEFERWPKYERLYRKACDNIFQTRTSKGSSFCIKTDDGQYIPAKNGDDIFDWWVNNQ